MICKFSTNPDASVTYEIHFRSCKQLQYIDRSLKILHSAVLIPMRLLFFLRSILYFRWVGSNIKAHGISSLKSGFYGNLGFALGCECLSFSWHAFDFKPGICNVKWLTGCDWNTIRFILGIKINLSSVRSSVTTIKPPASLRLLGTVPYIVAIVVSVVCWEWLAICR